MNCRLIRPVWVILSLCCAPTVRLHAERAPEWFTLFDGETALLTDGSRGPYRVSGRPVEADSERAWLNDIALVRNVDYRMDAARGRLTLLRDVPRGLSLRVQFRQPPQVLNPVHRRRVLGDGTPGSVGKPRGRSTVLAHRRSRRFAEDAALQIGGSKRVQVSVGSDRSHAVNQSLEVHISGEVAKGVDVLAVLSDRNLPIQASGSTRGLPDFERIFFQVRSRSVEAGVGDLEVAFDRTQFGRYRRQLQGAHLRFERNGASVNAFGAASRGRWTSHRIAPIEGYQGPYRLPGSGSGLLRRIVPESDRVFLNGRPLQRGDRLDYVIDYELGTVTFAPERPIVTDSRITVEYQVRDDGLQRRLMGIQSAFPLADAHLNIGATLIRESDRPVLSDVPLPGTSGSSRQLAVMDLSYEPRAGVRLDGEVALSDRGGAQDGALRLQGEWAASENEQGLRLSGRFRQVGAQFEGFESLDAVDAEGRWGWQPRVDSLLEREGEVHLRYTARPKLGVFGALGRRTGARASDRLSLGVVLPVGDYHFETIGRGGGRLVRHDGRFSGLIGSLRPGFELHLERADGDAVRGASAFYAHPLVTPLRGVERQEYAWDIRTEKTDAWSWRSEVRHRRLRQRDGAWRDSVRAWSFAHELALSDWRGWSVSGAYSRSVVQTGADVQKREVHHLGRVRMRHTRPGLTQQVTYRVSRTGVQQRAPIFVEVGRGLGAYVWEDVNGDGVQDPAEFVPDIDGDYDRLYADANAYEPASDGALGGQIELDFRRLAKGRSGLFSAVSLDASITADRQTTSGRVSPWSLLTFSAGDQVLRARRDVRMRLYLFRYHRRGSVQLIGRLRDRLDGVFYGGGVASLREGRALGRARVRRASDLEVEVAFSRRDRDGASAFAYAITSRSAALRESWRPSGGWQLRFGLAGGIDRESQRGLHSAMGSVQAQAIRSLPGRGRARASLDWTRVISDDALPLFLGMADGNRVGQNWFWQLGVDYRFGRYVTALLSYDGRKRPHRRTVHLGRMEMRAVF